MASRSVGVHWDVEGIIFIDGEGQIIAEFAWPKKGTKHVGMKSACKAYIPVTERSSRAANPNELSPLS